MFEVPRRRQAANNDADASMRVPYLGLGAAFVGQVATSGGGVDTFHDVVPMRGTGNTLLGGPVSLDMGGPNVSVLVLGPARPVGSNLIARRVDGEWVANRLRSSGSGGGGGGSLPNCFCDPIPSPLTMISTDLNCNFGMFQNATLQYGPTPPAYAPLFLGANCFLSVQFFADATLGGALFQYLLTCQFNQFGLARVYPQSPYGSPFRDGVLYSWSVGGYGNSCVPFHLDNGVAFPGSDASCFVKIDG